MDDKQLHLYSAMSVSRYQLQNNTVGHCHFVVQLSNQKIWIDFTANIESSEKTDCSRMVNINNKVVSSRHPTSPNDETKNRRNTVNVENVHTDAVIQHLTLQTRLHLMVHLMLDQRLLEVMKTPHSFTLIKISCDKTIKQVFLKYV